MTAANIIAGLAITGATSMAILARDAKPSFYALAVFVCAFNAALLRDSFFTAVAMMGAFAAGFNWGSRE